MNVFKFASPLLLLLCLGFQNLAAQPDLVITAVKNFRNVGDTGGGVYLAYFDIVVANKGTADVDMKGVDLSSFLGSETQRPRVLTQAGNKNLAKESIVIPKGQKKMFEGFFVIPAELVGSGQLHTFNLVLQLDFSNLVAESNEDNNKFSIKATVQL